MGALMARRLTDAGHQVTVWNRTTREVPGAETAASAADAVEGADLVITMLRDPAAVEEVLASAAPRPGTLVVEMSTIGPEAVFRIRSLLPEGTGLVDAPVLGSVQPAAHGTLTVLAGGTAADLKRCADVLQIFGTVHHVGPLGAGAAMKLAVMSALVPAQVLVAETLAYAHAQGVGRDALLEVLSGTPLGPLVTRLRPALIEGPPETRYALGLAAKDLDLAAHPAQTIAAAARERLAEAERAGLGGHDLTAILTSPTLRETPPTGDARDTGG